ncbi:hypothetical protein RJ639_041742 [Escallonia herrerae]|uniref:LRR receptor-like serine/threonine-protein kinase n=1 Tax=Escallonia herrerae TaxID=1293975 RepID=A0AA88WFN9_9ASTE|nr:hypothetical protein RJ639_041742 [Escallonia herrerae]
MVDHRTSRVLALCVLFLLLLFHSTFQQLVAPLPRSERAALLQLRSSLGLRGKDWPIKADPCSIWVGVQCKNGRVIGINVSGFKRTRIGSQSPQFAVDALANLSQLVSFNASRFKLPGSIPDWFGQQLVSLQVLDLMSCSISGAIPSSLGNLTNLTALFLSHNGLTGIVPSSLGQLSRLLLLDLSQNLLSGSIPSSFAALGNLTLLDMSSNYLSGTIPPAVGTLSKLQFLILFNNSLSSSIPAQIGDLSNLIDLDLSSNSLSGSLPLDLSGLRNMQRMMIGKNLLSGSLPGNLFSSLTRLEFLVLNDNDFTGEFPDTLWSMPGLRFLDASTNNFTGTLPPGINSNSSTNGVVFNLSQNMFYGGLTLIVRRFSFIDLSGNYFQGNVRNDTRRNASLDENCLRQVSSQRSVAQCASFYAERGLIFDNFGLPNATRPPSKPDKKSDRRLIILVVVLGGLGFIAFVVIMLLFMFGCPRRRGATNHRGTGVGPVPTGESPPPPAVVLNLASLGDAFPYHQILQATDNFSDLTLIKHGHSGDLFRAILEGGIPVVIKRIDLHSIKKDGYMLELDFFSKVSHPRLVPLLGHCLDNVSEKVLIYKYMPNGDLSSSLFKKPNSEDESLQSLDWITRLKIAIGAAEGLSYLHHDCNPPLVHRTSEQGASGTSAATCAYDVYCFGKVLLELVTGKLGISASSDATMKDFLEGTLPYISIYDKELVTNIVDPSLIIDEDLLEEVWAMAVVARSCLNPKPSRRPLMRYILKALENPLKVVREEHTSSARLRTTSSRGSWNAALFGSWRSSSDVAAVPAAPINKGEGGSSFKQSGTTGSQGSNQNGGGDHSSSTRRHSNEVFPEPLDVQEVETPNEG